MANVIALLVIGAAILIQDVGKGGGLYFSSTKQCDMGFSKMCCQSVKLPLSFFLLFFHVYLNV